MRFAKKLRRKTEPKVLEIATNNLLASLKKDMLHREGRVDYDKLRKEATVSDCWLGLKMPEVPGMPRISLSRHHSSLCTKSESSD
jgi:hypothetical protein